MDYIVHWWCWRLGSTDSGGWLVLGHLDVDWFISLEYCLDPEASFYDTRAYCHLIPNCVDLSLLEVLSYSCVSQEMAALSETFGLHYVYI